jgi:hypothetical protein
MTLLAVNEVCPVPPFAADKVPLETEEAFRDVRFAPDPEKSFAVITLVEKLPVASRSTILLAPLELEAVVLELEIVPAVIAVALRSVMFDPEKAAVLDPVPPLARGNTALLGIWMVDPSTTIARSAG